MTEAQLESKARTICKSMWALSDAEGSVMHLVVLNLIANFLAGFKSEDVRAEVACSILNFINQFVDSPSDATIN